MARKRKGIEINGIVVIDKPKGLSSNQALQKVKRLFNAQKAGHTGSLDPMATGVLPICFGQATKISQYLLDADKAYKATIQLGTLTDSGDTEGTVISSSTAPELTADLIQKVLKQFQGDIQQTPPMYSALKHQGRPLYEFARKGIEIKRKQRDIHIYQLECLQFDNTHKTIDIYVKCSKGTYIRSLAIDIGKALYCDAHLGMLKRFQCGLLDQNTMLNLQELEGLHLEQRYKYVKSAETAFTECSILTIPDDEINCFYKQGKLNNTTELNGIIRLYHKQQFIAIAHFNQGKLIAKQLFLQGIINNDQEKILN